MNKIKHIGVYGIILKEDSIVLINKVGGPYNGKLDLPGGSFEFGETPPMVLKRELKEEVGIDITSYKLFDTNSTVVSWIHKGNLEKCHHIGIFYKVLDYKNNILENININDKNDDSKGAKFYKIEELKKEDLSNIVILVLEKLGYKLEE